MTSEFVRDWELHELIERVERAYDAWGSVLLSDDTSDELRDVGDDVLCAIRHAAAYLLQLHYERLRARGAA